MSSSLPTTQLAWVFHKHGDPTSVLHLEKDYPVPIPSAQQILVRVHAVALNPFAYKAIAAPLTPFLFKKPGVPEADFSGVVVAESRESGLKIGQEVFGQVPALLVLRKGLGSLCQYVICEPALVTLKPPNVSHEHAASFPLAGLTAYAALVRHGGMKHGDGKRVFVNGGSGGVGAWAIQIAKAKGAYVVSTCSPSTRAFVTSLGADATVDYRSVQPSLPAHLAESYPVSDPDKAFDIIIDAVGTTVGRLYAACPAFLKAGGVYVDVAGTAHVDGLRSALSALGGLANRVLRPAWLGGTRRRYVPLLLNAKEMSEELQEAAELLASGTLKPPIDSVWRFENAREAYPKIMSGRARGKLVVAVD